MNLKKRIAKLEAAKADPLADLMEMFFIDTPVIGGTKAHEEMLADPRRRGITPVMWPDEPGPENPIL